MQRSSGRFRQRPEQGAPPAGAGVGCTGMVCNGDVCVTPTPADGLLSVDGDEGVDVVPSGFDVDAAVDESPDDDEDSVDDIEVPPRIDAPDLARPGSMLLDVIGICVDLDDADDVDLPKVMLEPPVLGAQGCCNGVEVTGGPTGVVGLCTERFTIQGLQLAQARRCALLQRQASRPMAI